MRVHQAEKRRKGMDTVQNRHNRITFIAKACICIFAALVVFGGLVVKASTPQMQEIYKYYTDIKVDNGMTLTDIAEDYMTEGYGTPEEYINEVRQINSICEDEIYYGQKLMIPYYSAELK
ncbi:MAG: hypothetical protein UDG86_00995 [Lachnospiraceae bacterium]|jgi:ABC-type transport system involved in cytochrome bd biosynthesis fused ATPase/permease subunit|nr:hypothetical protein [Lachnospiraceae bacterium]